MTRIRVSIVTYNNAGTIERCLESVQAQQGKFDLSVTVVDNASGDDTVERIRATFPDVELILPGENLGFAAAHNRVLGTCAQPYVLLLNPDAWLLGGALAQLLNSLEKQEDIALTGPRMEYEDGRPQLSFSGFPGLLADLRQRFFIRAVQAGKTAALRRLEMLLESPIRPDWISGSCFLARTDVLKKVGCFDERFFLYLEDVDLCRRLRTAGWRVLVEPRAICRHLEGHSHAESGGSRRHFRRSRLIYENKHGSRLGFLFYKWLRARDVDLRWDNELREDGPA